MNRRQLLSATMKLLVPALLGALIYGVAFPRVSIHRVRHEVNDAIRPGMLRAEVEAWLRSRNDFPPFEQAIHAADGRFAGLLVEIPDTGARLDSPSSITIVIAFEQDRVTEVSVKEHHISF